MKIPSKNKQDIERHIKLEDYFATLATVLDLLRQEMVENGGKRAHDRLLAQLRDDLLYLQEHYKIEPKQ